MHQQLTDALSKASTKPVLDGLFKGLMTCIGPVVYLAREQPELFIVTSEYDLAIPGGPYSGEIREAWEELKKLRINSDNYTFIFAESMRSDINIDFRTTAAGLAENNWETESILYQGAYLPLACKMEGKAPRFYFTGKSCLNADVTQIIAGNDDAVLDYFQVMANQPDPVGEMLKAMGSPRLNSSRDRWRNRQPSKEDREGLQYSINTEVAVRDALIALSEHPEEIAKDFHYNNRLTDCSRIMNDKDLKAWWASVTECRQPMKVKGRTVEYKQQALAGFPQGIVSQRTTYANGIHDNELLLPLDVLCSGKNAGHMVYGKIADSDIASHADLSTGFCHINDFKRQVYDDLRRFAA